MLRLIRSSLTGERDHCFPRSLTEGAGITHDALAHAEIVATAKHNGFADLTCENDVVGTLVFLSCHKGILAEIRGKRKLYFFFFFTFVTH